MDCPIVHTKNGPVKGKVSKANHEAATPVFNFLGIPYGKSPVGELRFVTPQKADPWKDVFEATATYGVCPQAVDVVRIYDNYVPYKNSLNHDLENSTEDCLNLNLFTPTCDKKRKLPVMVYFAGGHYQRNCGGRVDGTALAGMNSVVAVVPNFRVNAFGFLSFGKDSCCPGNFALLDVLLALEWVKENIEEFGGNPNNVTIFGESSGSGMVHGLMLSPLSNGLFHKAILLSGTLLGPFMYAENIDAARDLFLKNLDIKWEKENEKQILKTLQKLPAEDILRAQKDFDDFLLFRPNIDGRVLTDVPSKIIQSGRVSTIPLVIGCTNGEGVGILSSRTYEDYFTGVSQEEVKRQFTPLLSKTYPEADAEAVFSMFKKFYKTDENPNDHMRFSRLHGETLGDMIFVVPSVLTATAHTGMGNRTFLFQMTHQVEFNHSEVNGPDVLNKPEFCACDHADDLYFVWGVPFVEGQLSGGAYFSKDEFELSKIVMTYLTNFARSGDPNSPMGVDVKWPPYSSNDRQHMVLQSSPKVAKDLAAAEVLFYTQDLPKAGKM